MSNRYQVRRKPGYFLRVVDLEKDRVEGYWNFKDKTWFDLQAFMENVSGGSNE